ncbi:MalY/PatB family protein [Streptomyces sp. YS-B37]|uniref:MalY/PatB family protein n=1 Tax=Streptomyces sp. YS-B37 TaxID=3407669 RepID=UPI003B50FD94
MPPTTADGFDFHSSTPRDLRNRRSLKWNVYDADVLPLWVAEMDFPTAPVVMDAIRSSVDHEEFGYHAVDPAAELQHALASWAQERYDWTIQPERVHVLPDVLKGIELAIQDFTAPGSPVILPAPAYMPFPEVIRNCGRDIVEVPMLVADGAYVFDLEGIDAAFAAGAGSIILCNPHNPVGRAFTAAELGALAAVVDRHSGRVIADEIHAPLVYGGRRHIPYASVSTEAAAHSLTVMAASKAWNLPGLQCAQLITTNDADEKQWQGISFLRTNGASTVGIAASTAAYRDGGEWLDALLTQLESNRDLLARTIAERLPGVRMLPAEGVYLAWIDFRGLGLDEEPYDFLLREARVATNPGLPFGDIGRGFVRLNFGTTRPILEQALDAIVAAVRRRGE